MRERELILHVLHECTLAAGRAPKLADETVEVLLRVLEFVLKKSRVRELVSGFGPIEIFLILVQRGEDLQRVAQVFLTEIPVLLFHRGDALEVRRLRRVRALRKLREIFIAEAIRAVRDAEVRVDRQPAENHDLAHRRLRKLGEDLIEDHDRLPLLVHVGKAARHAEIERRHEIRQRLKLREDLLPLLDAGLDHLVVRADGAGERDGVPARRLHVLRHPQFHHRDPVALHLRHDIARPHRPKRIERLLMRVHFEQFIAKFDGDAVQRDQIFHEVRLCLELLQQDDRLVGKLDARRHRGVVFERVERHQPHGSLRRDRRVEIRIHQSLQDLDFVLRFLQLPVTRRLSRERSFAQSRHALDLHPPRDRRLPLLHHHVRLRDSQLHLESLRIRRPAAEEVVPIADRFREVLILPDTEVRFAECEISQRRLLLLLLGQHPEEFFKPLDALGILPALEVHHSPVVKFREDHRARGRRVLGRAHQQQGGRKRDRECGEPDDGGSGHGGAF